jgi:hypothetical protein
MGAPVMVVISVFMYVSVAEGAMWAHGEHESRRDAARTAGRNEHL